MKLYYLKEKKLFENVRWPSGSTECFSHTTTRGRQFDTQGQRGGTRLAKKSLQGFLVRWPFGLISLRGASGSVGALLQIVRYQNRLWFFWRASEPSGVGITLGPLGLLLVTDCARSWVNFEIRDSRNTRRFATVAVLAPVSRSSRQIDRMRLTVACSSCYTASKLVLHVSKHRESLRFVGQRPPPAELRDGSQPSVAVDACLEPLR
ncbi:hypothetical protein F2Q68_00044226 [Brassica cretica]|uniref:Uncharacterized protein n=1 Tax=Brassica cretica TaxID=69181 RepID=A0A8S9LKD7_BRACR|nr:hypothetical protein F2Q68_00044226 [Brassica cretica]